MFGVIGGTGESGAWRRCGREGGGRFSQARESGKPAGRLPVISPDQRRRQRQHGAARGPEQIEAKAMTDLLAAHPHQVGENGIFRRCGRVLFCPGWGRRFLGGGVAAATMSTAGTATGGAAAGVAALRGAALPGSRRWGRSCGRRETDAGGQVAQEGQQDHATAHGGQQTKGVSSPWTHGGSSGTATACFSPCSVGRGTRPARASRKPPRRVG